MSKLLLVARYEYTRNVLTKGFIFALLSLPLIIALLIGMIAFTVRLEERADAVGYVDQAGVLSEPLFPTQRGSSPDSPSRAALLPLIDFETEDAARQALEAKDIQAYYVITPDYLETSHVQLVYLKAPGSNVTRQVRDFLQINRLADLPPEIAERAVAGSNLTARWPAGGEGGAREFSERTFINNFLPLIVGAGFIMLLFMASGYLMQAVVGEKENRTMEVLMTSISPGQLMGGKILGISAVALTQLAGWVVFAILAVLFGGQVLGLEAFQHLKLEMDLIAIVVAVALPAFVMISALLVALGATVADPQEAQQLTGLFVLPTMIPIWLAGLIIEHPESTLSVVLSLVPFTALTTYSLRVAFTPVPIWQVGISLAILVASAAGAVWFAGRAFRLGMLRYGKRLTLRELIRR